MDDSLEEGEIPFEPAFQRPTHQDEFNGFGVETGVLVERYEAGPHESGDDWEQVVGKRMKRKKNKEKYAQKPAQQPKKPKVDNGALINQLYGPDPRASVEIKDSNPIRLADVQHLVLWVLGEGPCPRWAFIKAKQLIQQVVLVAAHGLCKDLFEQQKALLPTLAKLGPPAVVVGLNTTVRPGQTVGALLNLPTRKSKKRKPDVKNGTASTEQHAKNGTPPFPPSQYVMTVKQMEDCNYPLPKLTEQGTLQCPEGFVATQPAEASSGQAYSMVGLDCEMCITANGFELTRITLVNEQGRVLMDELVVPDAPITDHNTRYSGITATMLATCTNRLPDIQVRFLSLVSAETILVGHALENDLMALKVIHANCLDTALLFPHPKGPPYKSALKVLAQKFLKRSIQQGSHDSVVDARTAMDLALLKIKHGPAYGTIDGKDTEKLVDILAEHDHRSCLVDHPSTLHRYATGSCAAVPVTDDSEAAQRTARAAAATVVSTSSSSIRPVAPLYRFVWTQLSGLNAYFVQCANALRSQLLPNALPTSGAAVISQSTVANGGQAGMPHEVTHHAYDAPNGAAAKRRHSSTCELSATSNKRRRRQEDAGSPAGDLAGDTSSASESDTPEEMHEGPGPPAPPPPPPPEDGHGPQDTEAERLAALDRHVARIYEGLPVNSLLMVVTGQGDTAHIRLLQEMKYKRQSGVDNLPSWNLSEEEKMNKAAEAAIHGLCFCAVKQ